MKKSVYILLSAIMCLAVSSCSDGGKYEVDGNSVYYSYWTFSFGTITDTLPGADPATFQEVEDWIGKDKNHVYFKQKLVPGADPATLEVDKYPLFHDSKDYYFQEVPIHVADVRTFKVLKRGYDDDIWAIDSKCAYYDTIRISEADVKTFKVEKFFYATDKNHVYRYGQILSDADPATYKETENSGYATDKNHVWYFGEMIDSIVDRATFKTDKEFDVAYDKNGKIVSGKRAVEEEDENWPER